MTIFDILIIILWLWFSVEKRYKYPSEHSWSGGYVLEDFKGIKIDVQTPRDLLNGIKKSQYMNFI